MPYEGEDDYLIEADVQKLTKYIQDNARSIAVDFVLGVQTWSKGGVENGVLQSKILNDFREVVQKER